jgi:hypothetical protein
MRYPERHRLSLSNNRATAPNVRHGERPIPRLGARVSTWAGGVFALCIVRNRFERDFGLTRLPPNLT